MNSYKDYLNDDCTFSEFKSSLNLISPKMGKVYKQLSHSWAEVHFKIIYCDEKVALGISIFSSISMNYIGDYELFYIRDGFKYNDARPNYRLVEQVST